MATRKKVKYKSSIINLTGSPRTKKPPRKTAEYKGRTFNLPDPIRGGNNEDEASEYYIWRTQRDSKVRSSHAEREGKIFRWNDPPEGGNPGEDYNCRCWAEPVSTDTELPDVDELLEELDGSNNLPEDIDDEFDKLAEKYGTGAGYKMFSAKYGEDDTRKMYEKRYGTLTKKLKDYFGKGPLPEVEHSEYVLPGLKGTAQMTGKYFTGSGSDHNIFREGSPQVDDMKYSMGVERAREKYREKYKDRLSGKDNDLSRTSYTNYDFDFKGSELLDAGLNTLQQFTGSYRVDIYGLPKGKVRIEVSNKTHLKSLLLQIPGVPSWSREKFGPLGNITQKYIWTENMSP